MPAPTRAPSAAYTNPAATLTAHPPRSGSQPPSVAVSASTMPAPAPAPMAAPFFGWDLRPRKISSAWMAERGTSTTLPSSRVTARAPWSARSRRPTIARSATPGARTRTRSPSARRGALGVSSDNTGRQGIDSNRTRLVGSSLRIRASLKTPVSSHCFVPSSELLLRYLEADPTLIPEDGVSGVEICLADVLEVSGRAVEPARPADNRYGIGHDGEQSRSNHGCRR